MKLMEKKLDGNLKKNAMYSFEEILEATLDNTAAVRPLIPHLATYPNKTSKTCRRSKDELISNVLL